MLQSLEISADDLAAAAPSPKPIKLNAVVTKGNIRVVPISGTPGVSPQQMTPNAPASTSSDPVASGAAGSDNTSAHVDRVDTELSQDTPVAEAQPAPWNDGFQTGPADPVSIDAEAMPLPGLSLKMIKLIAAAAVLGFAAITLIVLQFSGSGKTGQVQASAKGYSSLIAAAGASPLVDGTAPVSARSPGGAGADIVAQMTAGTLAVLRNAPKSTPTATPASAAPEGGQTGASLSTSAANNGLYAMVLTALQQGQSRQYIDQMVNEAHRAQVVEVPAVLLTASGEVNTGALLTLFGGQ